MAVEPLNPARPQLGDPVLVDEELRAIKGVLKGHDADIGTLEDTTTQLATDWNNIPALIKNFMAQSTEGAALTALGGGTAGISIFRSDTMEQLMKRQFE